MIFMHKCLNSAKILCSRDNCISCKYNQNMDMRKYLAMNTSISIVPSLVICPYCLYSNTKDQFVFMTKSGMISKKFKCPDCQNILLDMTLESIIKKDYRGLAEWIIGYPFYEFWRKVKFSSFSKRLYDLNISKSFWDYYKLIKGVVKNEQSF